MTTNAQQISLDNALVASKNRRVISKCNMRINLRIKPKEPTYQVVLDALALTICYPAFLITVEVPVIYMHQFWATINKHNALYRFKIENKSFSMNVEVFREILNICPMIPGQEFDEPPSEEEALSFIHELGHSGEIKYITNVIVDHLHQSWRTFASIINKCLCGKVSGLDKIRLSRVQLLWGMYYKKNLDFVALIWEDLAYQIDNKDSKKQDKMFYPRFIKIIIHHFLKKDKSILMRNRTFMHTARDDSLLGTMRLVSRHEDTQVYGAILPEAMTNQAMLDSVAYKTYYAIASGAEPPKSKKSHKKSDSAISYEGSPSKKKSTSKPQPSKKKTPVKATRGKGRNVLAKDKDSWGNSDEEDNDDEEDTDDEDEDDNGNDDDDDNNDDNDMNDDDDDDTDSERTELDKIKIHDLNKSSSKEHDDEEEEYDDEFNVKEEENIDEEEDDDVIKELYKDVNVNLGNKDADMNEAKKGGAYQHNVSHGSGFEQEEEDAHVTLKTVHDKTEGPMQSSFVSSDFTSKLLNLENPSLYVNEIASLMNTVTTPPPPPFFNPLPQQTTPTPTPTSS
ncbi:retrovirus-related pol polyprotein from transposon TNT 1-94, partial [Tanacetum coccineum]